VGPADWLILWPQEGRKTTLRGRPTSRLEDGISRRSQSKSEYSYGPSNREHGCQAVSHRLPAPRIITLTCLTAVKGAESDDANPLGNQSSPQAAIWSPCLLLEAKTQRPLNLPETRLLVTRLPGNTTVGETTRIFRFRQSGAVKQSTSLVGWCPNRRIASHPQIMRLSAESESQHPKTARSLFGSSQADAARPDDGLTTDLR
jgi:hypothetical protein